MAGIKGKVALITGAGSGIGEATALMLAERDAKVATGSDRLKAVADRIVEAGGEAAQARTDVRRRGDVTNLINLASERSPGFEGKYPSDKFLVPRLSVNSSIMFRDAGAPACIGSPRRLRLFDTLSATFANLLVPVFKKRRVVGQFEVRSLLGL